jgi:hypothetical protein
MKKLILLALLIAPAAFGADASITVKVDLNAEQTEQLKFLARFCGTTNSLKDFSTNVVAKVEWTKDATFWLSQRRQRIDAAVNTAPDSDFTKLEKDLGLTPMTNNVPLFP